MATIIDGKAIAEKLCAQIKEKVDKLRKLGIRPHIAMINIGENPASKIYVSKKEKLAASLGIVSSVYNLGDNTTEEEAANLTECLNNDKTVHAVLLQSPLPKNLQFGKSVNLIRPDKDADGLTLLNLGKLFSGEPEIVPCTPLGVLHLLRTVRRNIAGLHAVVIGRSLIVGRPLAQLLLNANCSVTVLHSYSENIREICRSADILVSAVGRPLFIGKEFVKRGAVIIDVGINRTETNGVKKIIGDADFDAVSSIAEAITPVPNGVGPMTVAYLMYNTVNLACRIEGVTLNF
ncbi:MAG: bifunctional methylenetetrahydrofolate dehydrogenase/methenyltetrahydrofolate cyclohydrolase [Holosporaceae bacterium]|jgi:methylenetetrahydrofolate dehydrogenase (NADP+)/methenyltetrahydrofolate cyclohydrolase|nr:bifunctional methylenetetrahydrofolate dehydrogenase/methenyltetrahydrofolate cyclohydrolase [Holosporaceae bacterium]